MTELSIPRIRSPLFALPNLDRIIRGLLLVFIFSLPFKGLLFVERNGFIILLVLLGLWCVVHRGIFLRPTPIDLPFIAFVLWIAITIPFATYPLYSLKEFGKLLQQALVFYAVVFFFRDKASWVSLIWLLVGTSLIVSCYGLTQFDQTNIQSVTSFLHAEVWLTTYLVMINPLCFALAWYEESPRAKGFYVLSALFASGCLFMTRSRAGLVVFFVELWAFAWLLKSRAMLAIAGTITGIAFIAALLLIQVVTTDDGHIQLAPRAAVPINTSTSSFVHRLDIATFMLTRIAEHPIVGIGYGKETSKMLFGQVPEDVPAGHAPVWEAGAHNILLEMALHVGLPGLAFFLWLAVALWRALIGGFRRAMDAQSKAILLGASVGFVGLGVRVQFDQLFVGTLAIQFWVLTALAIVVGGSLRGEVPPLVKRDAGDAQEVATGPMPESMRS